MPLYRFDFEFTGTKYSEASTLVYPERSRRAQPDSAITPPKRVRLSGVEARLIGLYY
jgi:hypothetical protein